METITVTYSAGSFTASARYPDGTGARVVAAAKVRLNMPTATNAQVFQALANEFFNNVPQNTMNTEREIARATADANIPPIPVT